MNVFGLRVTMPSRVAAELAKKIPTSSAQRRDGAVAVTNAIGAAQRMRLSTKVDASFHATKFLATAGQRKGSRPRQRAHRVSRHRR